MFCHFQDVEGEGSHLREFLLSLPLDDFATLLTGVGDLLYFLQLSACFLSQISKVRSFISTNKESLKLLWPDWTLLVPESKSLVLYLNKYLKPLSQASVSTSF